MFNLGELRVDRKSTVICGCLGHERCDDAHRSACDAMQMLNLLLASGATAFVVTPPPLSPSRVAAFCPRIPAGPYACAADAIYPSPTAEQSAELETAIPTPALQPREVIGYVLTALHKSNFDTPRARFGCEVALRFLAPSNPASKSTPQGLARALSQAWYSPLLNWSEYRWEGDLTLLGQREAYQQLSVRGAPDQPWVSVRWILVRVPFYATSDQWMVEAVFVEEPDGGVPESHTHRTRTALLFLF